ncbi:molybdate ABC transporter substrate-binding protein [Paenibacillus chitinolyticus]|uniref:molybdate ABC transporter substrate-binding protein n=1 Tax=Paenibacillus chitinolyticus TaxID=79263 RepID=UPI003AF191E8
MGGVAVRMKRVGQAIAAGVLLLGLAACSAGQTGSLDRKPDSSREANGKAAELTVSAAASLKDALEEIGRRYESADSGVKLLYNFGSSGTLQKQIEQGAPADLFISAGVPQMKALLDKQLIDKEHSGVLLTNELVLIVPGDSRASIAGPEDLLKEPVKKIAVGEPKTVPAGSYTQEVLNGAGVWDKLQPKIVWTKDVRQVLAYVESGNADAGFVYKTDALTSGKVKTVYTAKEAAGSAPIEYPAGIVLGTKQAEEARKFYEYLSGPEARDIFTKYGFGLKSP